MKKIILDTDIGTDCDDCGALAVLYNLQKMNKCNILAVMCNIAKHNSVLSIKSINSWYGYGDIPIARTDRPLFKDNPRTTVYTDSIAEEYILRNPDPEIENAVTLYRKILASNTDITIISIGFLNNIADLLNSAPDEISPLNGVELVKKSVSKIYIIGGNFSGNETEAEHNIKNDIPSAQTVASCCSVPIVYLGREVGIEVLTGHTLWQSNKNSPIKKSYELFAKHYKLTNEDGTYDRPSWDPLTAYYAVTDDTSFMHESGKCTITFDDGGFTQIAQGGKDTYLILDNAKKAEETIETLISK